MQYVGNYFLVLIKSFLGHKKSPPQYDYQERRKIQNSSYFIKNIFYILAGMYSPYNLALHQSLRIGIKQTSRKKKLIYKK